MYSVFGFSYQTVTELTEASDSDLRFSSDFQLWYCGL
jgi:hypothetical protein